MGKIILNDIEYGIGTPNSSNVDTTNLVKKDNIVTVIDENVTDEQIPSAKAVHTAIQNVSVNVPVNTYTKEEVDNLLNTKVDTDDLVDAYSKEEVNNLLANKANSTDIIDAYTKTEVNDLLDDKANVDDIIDAYTKTEVDGLLNAKVDSANIVTTLSSSSTDIQIPSAKTVFDAIESVSAGVPADVYSKTDVDNLLANKADTSAIIDAYSKTEVDGLMNAKANTNDVYAKTDVDDLLSTKADSADIIDAYTKEEVNTLLDDKVNTDDLVDSYSKEEVNNLLNAKADSSDVADLYTKEEIDDLLADKANSSAIVDAYSKTEVDGLLANKVDTDDLVDSYSKTEVDDLLATKANSIDIVDAYTKTEVNTLLNGKANTSDIIDAYTKDEVDGLLANKANATALNDKVDKTAIVTSVSSTSTDKQVPSAKAVHTAIQEARTDLEEEFHTSMGKKMDVITSYLNSPSGDLLDTTVAPLVLCALSATNNGGLYKIMNDTFAYVMTYFYSSMSETSSRFQIAVGSKKDKMAFRRYNGGWSAWTEITTTTTLQSEINSFLTNKLTDYPTLEYLEDVKTELESEIANIPKVTKTSELTNDSGFITANDIPEVDLEPYALKTQIPTTLPASDVYAWAKASTKPTYTASEVGALPSNGTAVNASKVSNNLTLQIAGTTKNTFNGSSAQTFNIPNASTSTSGVMTADMVTKLNGIATGATKNTVDTAMSSTSTNAVQNKVIYAYIQEQIQNAGDYMGKTMVNVSTNAVGTSPGYTYTNAKGGFADLELWSNHTDDDNLRLIVDGVTIISEIYPQDALKQIGTTGDYGLFELKIPFTSTFTVEHYCSTNTYERSYLRGFIYVNK